MDQTGIVFNVQRFTIHDGPGVRTEFFFEGMPPAMPVVLQPRKLGAAAAGGGLSD